MKRNMGGILLESKGHQYSRNIRVSVFIIYEPGAGKKRGKGEILGNYTGQII